MYEINGTTISMTKGIRYGLFSRLHIKIQTIKKGDKFQVMIYSGTANKVRISSGSFFNISAV